MGYATLVPSDRLELAVIYRYVRQATIAGTCLEAAPQGDILAEIDDEAVPDPLENPAYGQRSSAALAEPYLDDTPSPTLRIGTGRAPALPWDPGPASGDGRRRSVGGLRDLHSHRVVRCRSHQPYSTELWTRIGRPRPGHVRPSCGRHSMRATPVSRAGGLPGRALRRSGRHHPGTHARPAQRRDDG